jgi:hypothetical protein
MAVKDFDNQSNLVMDVQLKTGKKFTNCDIPTNPMAVNGIISFWYEGKIMCYPIDNITYFSLYNKEDK